MGFDVDAARIRSRTSQLRRAGSPVVPLGRLFPAQGKLPPRIVVYRRPIESRAHDTRELTAIVQDVVVEQVAALLGVTPEQLDPRYGDDFD